MEVTATPSLSARWRMVRAGRPSASTIWAAASTTASRLRGRRLLRSSGPATAGPGWADGQAAFRSVGRTVGAARPPPPLLGYHEGAGPCHCAPTERPDWLVARLHPMTIKTVHLPSLGSMART